MRAAVNGSRGKRKEKHMKLVKRKLLKCKQGTGRKWAHFFGFMRECAV